jgi:hypothetical protein
MPDLPTQRIDYPEPRTHQSLEAQIFDQLYRAFASLTQRFDQIGR